MATKITCPHCTFVFENTQGATYSYDVEAIEAESRAMVAIANKPVWTVNDTAIYIRRSPYYVRQLFNKRKIRRDAQGLTRKKWVHDFLDKKMPKGRIKSPIHG